MNLRLRGWLFITIVLSISTLALAAVPKPILVPISFAEEIEWVYLPQDHPDKEEIQRFEYFDIQGSWMIELLAGDLWSTIVPCDDWALAVTDLTRDIEAKGGTIYLVSDERIVAGIPQRPKHYWWVLADDMGWGYSLRIIKETVLRAGESITFQPTGDQVEWRFITLSENGMFQSLIVENTSGEFWLDAHREDRFGEYSRVLHYAELISAEQYPQYILDAIPQGPGRLLWTLRWSPEQTPGLVTFTLKESLPLPLVRHGERLGALKVQGAERYSVRVTPTGGTYIYHPEFQDQFMEGNKSADGSHFFVLPSGFWDVRIWMDYPGISESIVKLIPINSGELTLVDLPPSLTTAFLEVEEPDRPGEASGIEILGVRAGQTEVTVEFCLWEGLPELNPTWEKAKAWEDGLPAKVLRLLTPQTPPSAVLLLDSSGSMRGVMDETLVVAREFLESLPDETFIQVVDFDTTARLLPGTRKEEVLAGLKGVQAGGATALYDSIMLGLRLLQGRQKPYLLVFTDGEDANWNDTGPGSKATLPEVVAAVRAHGVPLITIGFGPGHDPTVLQLLAEISGGVYYPAWDSEGLSQAFASINESFSDAYHLVYERPIETGIADTPVIYVVIDTSGSMHGPPEEEGCDWRMQTTKNILHSFILDLPDDALFQLQRFSWDSSIPQLMTMDRAGTLYAVGELFAQGGTDIIGSTDIAYRILEKTPSTRRLLIYITDYALIEDDPEYNLLLQAIGEEGIRSIWVGIGVEGAESAFHKAAEITGGWYVVSNAPEVLEQVFEQALNEFQDWGGAGKTELKIAIEEWIEEDHVRFVGEAHPSLPPRSTGIILRPESVRIQTGLDLASAEPSGLAAHLGRVQGISRIQQVPLDASAENSAIEIGVQGALIFPNLLGLEPLGMQFLALEVEMRNTLSIPYLIPDLFNHLFLTWNDQATYPLSHASWLIDGGLINPGEGSLYIEPGETRAGLLVFIVPFEPMAQASLHFYDLSYGHAQLALVGEIPESQEELTELPSTEPQRLSDTFSLRILGVEDHDQLGRIYAPHQSIFRVVEAELVSHVQALLDIDPTQVFGLRIQTPHGVFHSELNPITRRIPMGFMNPVMVAPGVTNRIRLGFQIPQALRDNPCDLYIDLKRDDVIIALTPDAEGSLPQQGTLYSGDGIDLQVNNLVLVPNLHHLPGGHWVIADITLFDHEDDLGTLLYEGFLLIREDHGEETENSPVSTEPVDLSSFGSGIRENRSLTGPDQQVTAAYLYGITDDTGIKDGTTWRGFLFFDIPDPDLELAWSLRSPFFPTLDHPVALDPDYDGELIVPVLDGTLFDQELEFNLRMNSLITAAIMRYQLKQSMAGKATANTMDINGQVLPQTVPVPPLTLAGDMAWEEISELDQLLERLRGVLWLPAADEPWIYRYAPEAVLTQNWGTENDMAVMLERTLIKTGYSPARRVARLTPSGAELLNQGNPYVQQGQMMPALVYWDQEGVQRCIVLPFLEYITEIGEYVTLVPRDPQEGDVVSNPAYAYLSVALHVISKDLSVTTQFGDMADALGGGGGESKYMEMEVFSQRLGLDALSLDAIDIAYLSAGWEKGELIAIALETIQGTIIGDQLVDTGLYTILGGSVRINLPYNSLEHQFTLAEGESITNLFQTLSCNAPDLPADPSQTLSETARKIHSGAADPDSYSALRWHTRSIVSQFIMAQSQFETELASSLDLVVGRTRSPRCLMVSLRYDPAALSFTTTIDLMGVRNEIHQGELSASNTFALMSGLFASSLEARILPGDGLGVFEIWARTRGASLLWMDAQNTDQVLPQLQKNGYPEDVIKRLQDNQNVILIPDRPAIINGVPRMAWLEIDPFTYYAIGVLGTGERGAMIEKAFGELLNNMTKDMLGGLMGVKLAVFSTAVFSLQYDDYELILTQAEALATLIAKVINETLNAALNSNPEAMVQAAIDKADELFEDFGHVLIGDLVEMAEGLIPKPDIEFGMRKMGFMEGMTAGIAMYMYNARQ